MKFARNERAFVAWMLYGCILFSAFACAVGHGQMAGLQLAGLDGQYCSLDGSFDTGADLDGSALVTGNPVTGSSCALASLFSAIILAALFGLWGLLAADQVRPLSKARHPRLNRYRWPPANPRASPLGFLSL